MPSRVVAVVSTPDGEHLYPVIQRALEKAADLFLEHGWRDDYFVTLTLEVRGREVEGDPDWLIKRLRATGALRKKLNGRGDT